MSLLSCSHPGQTINCGSIQPLTKGAEQVEKLQILPLTLYEFEASKDIHNTIVSYIDSLNWEDISHRHYKEYYGKSTKQYIHKDEKIKEFVLWQTEQVNKVKEEEKYIFCESLMPVSMWVNKSIKNEWHHRHTHSWSSLSCIYFVSGESGDTWFSRESEYHSKNTQLQDYCDTEICYVHKFKPRTLLVFPSKLEHSVSENMSDLPRVSISANYLPTGKVGMGMGYTANSHDFPWSP